MTCQKIPQGVLHNARSLEDVYLSLGVLKPSAEDGGTAAPAPRTFLPEGMPRSLFPYLTGNDGRAFNLAPLFAHDREKYNCALTALGYDEEKAMEIAKQADALQGQAYDDFVKNLGAADALNFSIHKTLKVMSYLKDKGNTDRNPNVVSASEIENWAWEVTNHDKESFATFGGNAVARLHAFMGIAEYMGTHPQITEAPAVAPAAVPAAVPDAGAGPRVISDVPYDGGQPHPLPPAGPFGGGVPTPNSGPNWFQKMLGKFVDGAPYFFTGALLGGLLVRFLMRRTPAPTKPTGPSAAAPAAAPKPEAPKPEPSKPALTPPAPKPASSGDSFLDEIDKSLAEAASAVTPENVIIKGPAAQPVAGLAEDVVAMQVILHHREFLSQTARVALQDGLPIKEGTELAKSEYKNEIREITLSVISEYYRRAETAEGKKAIDALWESQKVDHQYVVRRGVPQKFLLEIAGAYIEERKNVANFPLAGEEGARVRAEATRDAGEARFFENGLREFMRHIGR